MFVKAAINGGRQKSETHAVPVTAEEIALDALSCVKRGADVVHAHARTEQGKESIAGKYVAEMVTAVKQIDSDLIIGTTTGLWTCNGHLDRMNLIKGWPSDALPDFASITYHEEGADEVAELILERGMILESAAWNMQDLSTLLESPFLKHNVRILIEPEMADVTEAVAFCRSAKSKIDELDLGIPILFHGFDSTFWPIVKLSIAEGVQTRIGFEDVNYLPDHSPAKTNLALFDAYYALVDSTDLVNTTRG